MVMLFGITVLFNNFATLNESFAVYLLLHKGLMIGTNSLAREYVAVLMADKTGLQGVCSLWTFGRP